jgi:hypothetical protein
MHLLQKITKDLGAVSKRFLFRHGAFLDDIFFQLLTENKIFINKSVWAVSIITKTYLLSVVSFACIKIIFVIKEVMVGFQKAF